MMPTTEGGLDVKLNLTHALDRFSGNEHSLPVVPLFADVVKLSASTGISYTPTLLVAWEMWALASGGWQPLEVLRAATLHGAEAIGYAQDLGSLEAGKLADLVVLPNDPLKDIHNTSSIRYVMKTASFSKGIPSTGSGRTRSHSHGFGGGRRSRRSEAGRFALTLSGNLHGLDFPPCRHRHSPRPREARLVFVPFLFDGSCQHHAMANVENGLKELAAVLGGGVLRRVPCGPGN